MGRAGSRGRDGLGSSASAQLMQPAAMPRHELPLKHSTLLWFDIVCSRIGCGMVCNRTAGYLPFPGIVQSYTRFACILSPAVSNAPSICLPLCSQLQHLGLVGCSTRTGLFRRHRHLLRLVCACKRHKYMLQGRLRHRVLPYAQRLPCAFHRSKQGWQVQVLQGISRSVVRGYQDATDTTRMLLLASSRETLILGLWQCCSTCNIASTNGNGYSQHMHAT